jgi:hypothetical protein
MPDVNEPATAASADGRGCRRHRGAVLCGERTGMRGMRTKVLRTIAAEDRHRERDEKREERRRRRRLRRTEQHRATSALPADSEMHDHPDAAPDPRR